MPLEPRRDQKASFRYASLYIKRPKLPKEKEEEEKGRSRQSQKQAKSTQTENERGEEGEENKRSKKQKKRGKEAASQQEGGALTLTLFIYFAASLSSVSSLAPPEAPKARLQRAISSFPSKATMPFKLQSRKAQRNDFA
ncbi:hypothetical protein ACLB2K_029869 [Fragaria x ananassa]